MYVCMSVVVDVDVEESHATIKSGLNGAEMGTDGWNAKAKERGRQSKKKKSETLQEGRGGKRNGDAGSYLYATYEGGNQRNKRCSGLRKGGRQTGFWWHDPKANSMREHSRYRTEWHTQRESFPPLNYLPRSAVRLSGEWIHPASHKVVGTLTAYRRSFKTQQSWRCSKYKPNWDPGLYEYAPVKPGGGPFPGRGRFGGYR